MSEVVKMLEQIKRHEGLKLKPYKCTAGKITIGYGRNLDDVGITEQEAESMLSFDLMNTLDRLKDRAGNLDELSPARRAVVANMAFNMGVAGLMTFKKMWAAIEVGDWETASHEMLDSDWYTQVGDRAVELSEQMRTGEWKNEND